MVVVAAAPLLVLTASASAADWLANDQPILRSGSFASQQAPSIASDPGNGMSEGAGDRGYLVAVASDWNFSAPLRRPGCRGRTTAASPGTPSLRLMPHGGGSFSGGSPSVAWLDSSDDTADPTAVVAERGRGADACDAQGGIYLGTYEVDPNPLDPAPNSLWIGGNAQLVNADVPASFTTSSSPAVAVYDPAGEGADRIHVAYVRATWADDASCGTGAATLKSEIWLASRNAGGGGWAHSLVSSIAGDSITPSIAVRADGNVVVVWYDRAVKTVQSRICSGLSGCDSAPLAVAVRGGAIGTVLPSGLVVTPAPSVAVVSDLSERIVVAWSEWSAETDLDVMSATSKNGGASFIGPDRANDDVGATPQFGASLAAGARGQVELAFLDGRTGSLLPMASASRTPLPAFGEAWSSNVTLSTTPIDPTIGLPAGAPQLSPHPISVASLALDVESNLDPLPVSRHALAAWTDTRSVAAGPQAENRDLHAVVLRHGSTLPTLGQPEYPISKRAIKDLQLAIVDPDGDPVQMLLLDSPSTAIVPNENLPFLNYTSPATTGKEFLRVSLSDGKGRSSIVEFYRVDLQLTADLRPGMRHVEGQLRDSLLDRRLRERRRP